MTDFIFVSITLGFRGQIPVILNAELTFFGGNDSVQALQNSSQNNLFVIETSPKLLWISKVSCCEYAVDNGANRPTSNDCS